MTEEDKTATTDPKDELMRVDPKTGSAFDTRKDAEAFMLETELDSKIWQPITYQNGWAVAQLRKLAEAMLAGNQPGAQSIAAEAEQMAYWWVSFSGKANPNDLEYVPLKINNFTLRAQREVEICLPENFVLLAEQACRDQYAPSSDPEQPVEITGKLHRYPVRRIKKGSREEFLKTLDSGNKITNDALERLQAKK